jgi:hypothetical protein
MPVGIRETLNKSPALTTGATIGIIVLVLGYIFWHSSGGGPVTTGGKVQAFFSDDDGKTYFADDASKVAPFDHNGKQAVRAWVYSCNGKKFVSHLERYTPEAKVKLEQARAQAKGDLTVLDAIQMTGVEVKKPGEGAWVKQTDPRAAKITQPDCNGTLELVSP